MAHRAHYQRQISGVGEQPGTPELPDYTNAIHVLILTCTPMLTARGNTLQ